MKPLPRPAPRGLINTTLDRDTEANTLGKMVTSLHDRRLISDVASVLHIFPELGASELATFTRVAPTSAWESLQKDEEPPANVFITYDTFDQRERTLGVEPNDAREKEIERLVSWVQNMPSNGLQETPAIFA